MLHRDKFKNFGQHRNPQTFIEGHMGQKMQEENKKKKINILEVV